MPRSIVDFSAISPIIRDEPFLLHFWESTPIEALELLKNPRAELVKMGIDLPPDYRVETTIENYDWLAASPRPPHSTIRRRPDRELIQTMANGAAGNPGNSRHRGNPTPAGDQRLARRKNAPLPLVQIRAERLEPPSYRRFVDHESKYGTTQPSSTTIC